MIKKLTISKDVNGNKTIVIKMQDYRPFSIQTLGNLPVTHRGGINKFTISEISDYIDAHGTPSQKVKWNS